MIPDRTVQRSPFIDSPLRQPALYNPHLLSQEELSMLFVARKGLLRNLLEELKGNAESDSLQHHLILGQRGMGKTMLLRRIQIAIEEDPRLAAHWIPITFPEEQYNVRDLSDFWFNCLDALGDLLDRRGDRNRAQALDRQLGALDRLEGAKRSGRALEILENFSREEEKRLILLVDNIDLILDRIRDEQWSLREVLSTNKNLLIVGASSRAIEATYRYDQAFYDFFRIHELSGLDFEETRSLLLSYADRLKTPQVREIVESDPGRIQSLHTLTGGNPRTITLLYRILLQGMDGDVRTDLEQLLDQCTPLYKARIEKLPPQAQQLVHGLAVHWDPISAGELAEQLRLDVNSVSSQLSRLVKQGIVQKVPYDPPTKTGFQIAERFFNIWYLMRASRRVRQRLLWLVHFMRLLYGTDGSRVTALELRDSRVKAGNPSLSITLDSILGGTLEDPTFPTALKPPALRIMSDIEKLQGWNRQPPPLEASDESLASQGKFRDAPYWNANTETRVRRILKALDRGHLGERWRPLREACRVIASGDASSYLRRLAPEVRAPTKNILNLLAVTPSERLKS